MTDEQERRLRSVYVAAKEAYLAGCSPEQIDAVSQIARNDRRARTVSRAKRDGKVTRDELKKIVE